MKAILENGDNIDLGRENVASLLRNARLLHRGVFTKLILEQPVPTTGWNSDHPIGGYWALVQARLLTRTTTPVWHGANEYCGDDVVYTVVANVEFTNSNGDTWQKGDSDEWLK